MDLKRMYDGVIGAVVGDALGVPYEFSSREAMKNVTIEMKGYGTHSQPKGTWSDDSSMMLASLDCVRRDRCDTEGLIDAFRLWDRQGMYSADGMVFDIGIGTSNALSNTNPEMINGYMAYGSNDTYNNGNGSLMRILPVCIYA
ncbi:MAG: ADP-ribosylglycohydrolase family protein, partial [Lachnospiraceae bacterium]|nr:ADP-ribosylglycohydrolase family protein [Lachnospiraceae bacterium]